MQERLDRLAQALLRALAARGHGMAVAESLTGGMLANALVRIPGASRVFQAGVVAYCNRAKADMLGVSAQDLTTLGAVSEPVARQMALGLLVAPGIDLGLSTTGIAGPTGDAFCSTIGLTYIGVAYGKKVEVFEHRFEGDRESIRQQAVEAALRHALDIVK